MENLKTQIAQLQETILYERQQSDILILTTKAECNRQIEKFRISIHEKDKMINVKDSLTIKLQTQAQARRLRRK